MVGESAYILFLVRRSLEDRPLGNAWGFPGVLGSTAVERMVFYKVHCD